MGRHSVWVRISASPMPHPMICWKRLASKSRASAPRCAEPCDPAIRRSVEERSVFCWSGSKKSKKSRRPNMSLKTACYEQPASRKRLPPCGVGTFQGRALIDPSGGGMTGTKAVFHVEYLANSLICAQRLRCHGSYAFCE